MKILISKEDPKLNKSSLFPSEKEGCHWKMMNLLLLLHCVVHNELGKFKKFLDFSHGQIVIWKNVLVQSTSSQLLGLIAFVLNVKPSN